MLEDCRLVLSVIRLNIKAVIPCVFVERGLKLAVSVSNGIVRDKVYACIRQLRISTLNAKEESFLSGETPAQMVQVLLNQ